VPHPHDVGVHHCRAKADGAPNLVPQPRYVEYPYNRVDMNPIRSILVALLVFSSVGCFSASASAEPVPGQILVKFRGAEHGSAHRAVGGLAVDEIDRLNTDVVKVAAGQEEKFLQRYRLRDDVVSAERDEVVEALSADPGWSRQWGFANNAATIQPDNSFIFDADADVPEGWALASPAAARVAVLDTGIDQDHPDLAGKLILQKNFTTSKTVDDRYGHGTHVAGVVAAIAGNNIGVAGGAPNASLLNAKVLGDNGSGSCSGVANGIIWAADQGAKVISMSLGGGACNAQNSAVQYAWNKGSVLVAAAGNSSTSSTTSAYPAAYKPTLAVASTDNSDLVSSFSNFGSWVEIAAPGERIYSTMTNHNSTLSRSYGLNYATLSGTSMATPLVSAAAAFIQPADTSGNGFTNDEIRTRLLSSSDRPSAVTSKIGGGRLNLCRAVSGASSC
jgi:thermitase